MSGLRLLFSLLFAAVVLLAPAAARAEPLRILIAASHPVGRPGEQTLKHADDDAKSVRDVFVRLGGVTPEHALLVRHPTADDLLHAIDHAAHLAQEHGPGDVSVVFYFSGHGDRDAIHLAEERLPIAVLESRLAQVTSSLRIVVLDACRTNDGRSKGFTDAEPFTVVLPEETAAKGTVLLHASADGEVAQESDALGGAVFTHYWVNGLAGAADANNDGQVTLGEAYAYAYQQTLWRSALSSGVAQRPSAVIDLAEAAPLVLTRTSQTSAIRFPLAGDTHYIVYGVGSQTVVGDLWGAPDHATVLAVTPGHYIVHRRGSGVSSAAEVVVSEGEQRPLATRDFLPFSDEALSQKGGMVDLHPDEISAGYSIGGMSRLVSVGQEVDVRYTHSWDRWAIGVGAHGGTGSLATSYFDTDVQWLGVEALVERRIPLGWPTLRLGGGVVGEYVRQTLRRTDAAGLEGTPYATGATDSGFFAGGRAFVGLRIPLVSRLWLDAEGRCDLLGTALGGSPAALVRGSGLAAVGWAF